MQNFTTIGLLSLTVNHQPATFARKNPFRSVCEKATGAERKDVAVFSYSLISLDKLDRFVAAMYTVTHGHGHLQVQEGLRARAMSIVDENGTQCLS